MTVHLFLYTGFLRTTVGDFWPTRERFLIHGYMTRGMFQDDFYLISRMVEVKDLDIWEVRTTLYLTSYFGCH